MAVGTSYQPWDPMATLTRYALEQSKPSAREQQEKLAPQEHDALCMEFNEARPLIQRDAPATKENLHGITKKFVEYVSPLELNDKDHTTELISVLGTVSTVRYQIGGE
jgi:hypothetical protein